MGIVQRIIFKPQSYFQKFVFTLIPGWGIAAIVPLYFRIQDLWGYGKVNGPISSSFIFQFFSIMQSLSVPFCYLQAWYTC